MQPKVIPDVVSGQTIRSLTPADSAHAAARLMREHDISAVAVLDQAGVLVGIVTERDLARRVVADDRQASSLLLSEVMTAGPATVEPGASPFEVLELMRSLRVRHLPIVEAGKVVGMVSIRDLRQAIASISGTGGGSVMGRLRRFVSGAR
jgi:CBS domain-containing protein